MSERDINFAKSLASGGYAFDREIQQQTKDYVKAFSKTDFFLIAIAQSLTWTGHAIDKTGYFKKALGFLTTGSEQKLSTLTKCTGRYGAERLKSTLSSWRNLYNELDVPANVLKSSLEEIIIFQKTSYEIACAARKKRKVMGIGAWLFCAPFKILLCLRDEFWNHDRVDEVLMPLGLEVVRGVKKLIRNRYLYSDFVNEGDLLEEEGGILDGLAIAYIVQAMCKTIAKDAGSNVLHINSGLWKFGAGDL